MKTRTFVTVTTACETHSKGHEWFVNLDCIVLIQPDGKDNKPIMILWDGDMVKLHETWEQLTQIFARFKALECRAFNGEILVGLVNPEHVFRVADYHGELDNIGCKIELSVGGPGLLCVHPTSYVTAMLSERMN